MSMTDSYDYGDYGKFKASAVAKPRRADQILRHLGLKHRYLRFVDAIDRSREIVEIGCGSGAFLAEMRAAGFELVQGVDLSPSYDGDPDIHIGDAAEYLAAKPDGSLGGIVAFDVFEHIPLPSLLQLGGVIASKLRPDGKLIFRVPNLASPLALYNQYGDLSHVTAMNEASVRQLAFDTGMVVEGIYPEPLGYPRSVGALVALLAWPIYREMTRLALLAFGVRARVLTPNLVCVMSLP